MTTQTAPTPTIDEIMGFAFKVVGELGAALAGAHVYIGDRLGLFKTLSSGGPVTPAQLSARTGLQERYLQEWSAAMAASGFIDYDPISGAFSLPPAKAAVLADEDSPVFVGGLVQMIPDHYAIIPDIIKAFHDGGGVPYTSFTNGTFEGTERFFRPGYINFLVQDWLPATGFVERLSAGAKVADVGCGRGQAICTLAKSFPNSRFWGFDNHAPGIEAARQNANSSGVGSNTTWEVRGSTELPATAHFDLVTTLDSLHDMVDPHAAGRAIYGALRPGGAWFIVEPNMSDKLEENLNPVGRVFYSVSMLQCMTASLAHGGAGYGAGMGPSKIERVAMDAGFSRFEKLAIENPFNQYFLATK